ncbi:MAG: YceI family protein [Armatimonadota bacterium]|nr:YceI family protein [Armatimonadota bacterium]
MRAASLACTLIMVQVSTLLPVGTFRAGPGDSRVEFVMRDNRGGFVGWTEDVAVAVTVWQADAETGSAAVEAWVDARTLETGSSLRNAQMRRDFLQTDRYPFVSFKGVAISRDRLTGITFRAVLRGSLTIRAITRDLEMPLVITALADEYRATGEVTIRLADYGMRIPRFLFFVAEDVVVVRVRIRLVRSS